MTIIVGPIPCCCNLASICDELRQRPNFVRALLLDVVTQDEHLAFTVLILAVKHCIAYEKQAAQAALVLISLVVMASRRV